MYFFSFAPIIANIFGYSCALVNSFSLNRFWTFKSQNKDIFTLFKFLLVFFISYILQLTMLALLLNHSISPYVAQIISIIVYIIVGFFGNKIFTF